MKKERNLCLIPLLILVSDKEKHFFYSTRNKEQAKQEGNMKQVLILTLMNVVQIHKNNIWRRS